MTAEQRLPTSPDQKQQTFYTVKDIQKAADHLRPSTVSTLMINSDLVHHRGTGRGKPQLFDETVFREIVADLSTRRPRPKHNGKSETTPENSQGELPTTELEQSKSLTDLGFTTAIHRSTVNRILARRPDIKADHREGRGRGTARMFDSKNAAKLREAYEQRASRKPSQPEEILPDGSKIPVRREDELDIKLLDILLKTQQNGRWPISLNEIADLLLYPPDDSKRLNKTVGTIDRLRAKLEKSGSKFEIVSQFAYMIRRKAEDPEKLTAERIIEPISPNGSDPTVAAPDPSVKTETPPEADIVSAQELPLQAKVAVIAPPEIEQEEPAPPATNAATATPTAITTEAPRQSAPADPPQPKSPNGKPPEQPTAIQEVVIWERPEGQAPKVNSKRDYEKIREGVRERLRRQEEMRRQLEIDVAHTILTNFVRSKPGNDLLKTVEKNVETLLRAHMPEGVLLESVMPHDYQTSSPMTMDEFLAKALQKALNQCFDPDFQLTGDASEKEKELVNLFAPYRQGLAEKFQGEELAERRALLKGKILSYLCGLFKIRAPSDEPPLPQLKKGKGQERLFSTSDLQEALKDRLIPNKVAFLISRAVRLDASLIHDGGGKGQPFHFAESLLPKLLATFGLSEEDVQAAIAKLQESTASNH